MAGQHMISLDLDMAGQHMISLDHTLTPLNVLFCILIKKIYKVKTKSTL